MSDKQIRVGQLIAPFGPGSIYTDRQGTPLVIAGLDHWYESLDPSTGEMLRCSNPLEFEIYEPRLSALLHVNRFRKPPDFRYIRRDQEVPPNAGLKIPSLRFLVGTVILVLVS